MTGSPPGDVRGALRAATRAAHDRLDAHPLLTGLMRGDAGLERYGCLLRRYAQLYADLEAALDRGQDRLPDGFIWPERRKLPWLETDLRFLGLDVAATSPTIGSKAEAIGLLYPLEGATLGGLVIAKHLRSALGVDDTHGARFFSGYGAETRARWEQTCRALEDIAGDDRAIEDAARQAVAVFERFGEALDRAAAD